MKRDCKTSSTQCFKFSTYAETSDSVCCKKAKGVLRFVSSGKKTSRKNTELFPKVREGFVRKEGV